MKKLFALFLIILLSASCALCEESDAWRTAPVITKAYELSAGKLYLEWEGQAPVYQVYMDGESVANIIVNNAVIDVAKGTHALSVYPINEAKAADTKINLGIGGDKAVIGGNIDVDLAILGLDPKNLTSGSPSTTLNIDYTSNPILSAAPTDLTATTDWNDVVHLSFVDRYFSDEYVVTIKVGKDTNYVRFVASSDESGKFITKSKDRVTLALDPDYLTSQECTVPELDTKYSFSVQLRKYAKNLITNESIAATVHASKDSNGYSYTPVALWKTAPVVSYASQTADGQITLQWTHDDNGLGCQYAVMKAKKTMGIKTGEEEVAVVTGTTFVLNDLMNGKHSFTIVPQRGSENGTASNEASIEIKNDWVVAPILTCVQTGEGSAKLTWSAEPGVESYHITVFTGDNASLLRFVNLDFTKLSEHDLASTGGNMEFTFVYSDAIDPENGQKVKFEVYGIRHASNGDEQKTATSSQTVILTASGSTAQSE